MIISFLYPDFFFKFCKTYFEMYFMLLHEPNKLGDVDADDRDGDNKRLTFISLLFLTFSDDYIRLFWHNFLLFKQSPLNKWLGFSTILLF